MRQLFKTALATLLIMALFACSKANNNASAIDPRTGKHPANWVVADNGGEHPAKYLAVPSSCYECHGKNLAGGISNVSCFSASRHGIFCHPQGPSGHPAGWAAPDIHGAAAKAKVEGRNGMPRCQRCHGINFAGTALAPTCFNNAGCHGDDVRSPHSRSPWLSKIGGRTHSTADTTNAVACAVCHSRGANSSRKPSPVAPAGTAPGCFNNTLCHGVEGHAAGWTVPTAHGAAAKAKAGGITVGSIISPYSSFAVCAGCHGDNYAGGTALQSCLNNASCHGANVSSPHPAKPWRSSTGGVTHTDTATENAGQCELCHKDGDNSTRKPVTGDPVGLTGCFNNTLCHGSEGHPAGWKNYSAHGKAAKKAPTAITGFSSCRACHGSTFNNGTAPTCMNTLACHGLTIASPHPARPWSSTTPGAPTHTNTDTGNVGICAICHTGGDYSTLFPPTPATGTAGCYNNTLCHFHQIPYAPPAVAPGVHGGEAKKDLRVCQSCHGTPETTSFNGGSASVACSSCHPAAKAHPTDWQGSGTYSHRTAGNIANACIICHDVNNGRTAPLAAAPSCFSASFTNALGQARTCHSSGPGAAPHAVPYPNHNAAALTNFGYCLGCHQVAANATIPPGCMNCHLADPTTVSSLVCTTCHGNPPNSSGYPNIAAAHGSHVAASKVATITLVCADCHNGLGLATVDHQVRAKARTASVQANPVVFSSKPLIVAGGGTAPAFTSGANGQCTNTYCHGAKMPGGDTTGSNRAPFWGTPFLPATLTVAACVTCHGFPPSTASGHPALPAPTSFPLGSNCICHDNVNSAGTTYANIFVNKALHVNGTIEATGFGHGFPYSGSAHLGASNGTGCLGCHVISAAANPYPVASGTPPNCRACHLNADPTTNPHCSDCHGASATDGRPSGNAFPNRQGGSDGHNRSTHRVACTICHSVTTGSAAHGWSNRTRSSNAQVVPALNWNPGTRAAGTGSCNPSSLSGCHDSKTGWY